jgi:hypothetical protein
MPNFRPFEWMYSASAAMPDGNLSGSATSAPDALRSPRDHPSSLRGRVV